MPDRTSELADDYAAMQKLARQTTKGEIVDGDWYLFEQEGRLPRLHQEINGMLDIGNGHTAQAMQGWGWTVTSVLIYRKS